MSLFIHAAKGSWSQNHKNISRQAPCCQEYSYHKTLGATIKMKFTVLHIAQKQLGLQ